MDLNRSGKFEKLLEIESELELWNYNVNGVHLWPLIRTNVYSLAENAMQGYCQAHASRNYGKFLRTGPVLNFLKTGKLFISREKHFDSVFFTTARNQRYNPKTTTYYDQFYQPYFSLFLKPLIFEGSYQDMIKQPRELERNTFLLDFVPINATIKSFKAHILGKQNEKEISEFLELICRSFMLSNNYSYLYKKLYRRVHAAQHLIDYTDNIACRMDGNIAFVHCSSYLADMGVVTKRLKDNGITTVELQHGYVSPEHFAYNYPVRSTRNIAKEYLPDYYLTFGEYWNEQIQTPSTAVAVGNPSFNIVRGTYENTFTEIPNSILIVSQGTVTPKMVEIAKYLSQAFSRYTIFFKLHPGEVPFTHRYEDLKKHHNIQIKTYDNIYELIASSEIIVGYDSTTLFEALAFSGKRIFILNNNLVPDSLGYKFSSCEELRDAILDGESGYPSAQPSYFWEPNWKTNMSSFLNGFCL